MTVNLVVIYNKFPYFCRYQHSTDRNSGGASPNPNEGNHNSFFQKLTEIQIHSLIELF